MRGKTFKYYATLITSKLGSEAESIFYFITQTINNSLEGILNIQA